MTDGPNPSLQIPSPRSQPTLDDVRASLADAEPAVHWLQDRAAPEPQPSLTGRHTCDLLIVGGGYTGLWAALRAKERDPSRGVYVIEAQTIPFGGSGRNGGFCVASITHGLRNGVDRFPGEIERLLEVGQTNLRELRADVERYGIDCALEPTGLLELATQPHEVAHLRESFELAERYGQAARWLDADAARAEVDSPTYLAGLFQPDEGVMVHPARLAWGLRQAALERGVQIFERTPATDLSARGAELLARTPLGEVVARKVLLATNAFPPLLRAIRRYVVPVYDYALMTEPLSSEQLAAIRWDGRQGIFDAGNQFHYYRLTADNRMLWGGYDAIYHYGNAVRDELYQRPETFTKLAEHFFQTFPQLRGLRFTNRWGGAIDTCSRFSVMFGTAMHGRVSYAVGYTGLGVGATRFGAHVALDLLDDPGSELANLEFVRSKPIPFPPEPLRWAGIQMTRRSLMRADETGRRGLWLRTLDRLGLGFDS